MAWRRKETSIRAPFLRSLFNKDDALGGKAGYPFDLPWLGAEFALEFSQPVTILVGENGTGKSTLIEAIAALAGYDEAGGCKGYIFSTNLKARCLQSETGAVARFKEAARHGTGAGDHGHTLADPDGPARRRRLANDARRHRIR